MTLHRFAAPFAAGLALAVVQAGASSAAEMAAADSAAADAVSTAPGDELTVTGQRLDNDAAAGTKTDALLIETPQSISVISDRDMELRGVNDLNQALRYTAGVSPELRGGTASRYDQLNVRGFQPPEYLDGLLLLGGSYYATPQVDVSRLERIEVVKGPSSVLYGQAAPGGIVDLVSKRPTEDFGGEVHAAYGTFNVYQAGFDLGGPVDAAKHVLFRINGQASGSDAQVEGPKNRRYNIDAALTWQPDDRTSWTVIGAYQTDPEAASYGSVPIEGSLRPNPVTGKLPRDFYDGDFNFEKFDRQQASGSSFFKRQLTDWLTFRQNLRYLRTEALYKSVYSSGIATGANGALDYGRLARGTATSDESADAFNVDNQLEAKLKTGLASHDLLVGLDYTRARQTLRAGFGVAPDLDLLHPDHRMTIVDPGFQLNEGIVLKQTGLYGQDAIKIGGLNLLASGRYDWFRSRTSGTAYGEDATAKFAQEHFTGRAGALYLFDNGLAPYVSYATSFEPQSGATFGGEAFQPTTGKQVEAGLKFQPKGFPGLFTAAVYDLRQQNVVTGDPDHPNFSIQTGEVRSRGVELEARVRPVPALELTAAYTYIDNKVTKDNSGLQGHRPVWVPKDTASLFGVYTFAEGALHGLGLGGGVRYIGNQQGDPYGTLPVPDYTLVDAVLTYELDGLSPALKGWNAVVNANNLFDRTYVSGCYGGYWCWYGYGRTVQAKLTYRW